MNIKILLVQFSLLTFFSFSTVFANEEMIDNFDNNPEKRWIFFADTVMGGKSSGNVTFSSDTNNNLARLTGNVTTQNNGGFIQIRKKVLDLDNSINEVKLMVKGNNQVYHVFIRTSGTILPWQYYKAEFKATNEWTKISIPIANFQRSSSFLSKKINPNSIKSIGLVAYGRDFKADLYISNVSFK